jgi:hypothetical protein
LNSLADFLCELLDTADDVPAFLAANNKSFVPIDLLSGHKIGKGDLSAGVRGDYKSGKGRD